MDAKNGNNNNEKLLFHGTSSTTLGLINNSGFNRSYAGMNGEMIIKAVGRMNMCIKYVFDS